MNGVRPPQARARVGRYPSRSVKPSSGRVRSPPISGPRRTLPGPATQWSSGSRAPRGAPVHSLEGLTSREALIERLRPGSGYGEEVVGSDEVRGGRPITVSTDAEGQIKLVMGSPRPGSQSADAGTDAAPGHRRGGGAGQDAAARAGRKGEGRPLRPPFPLQHHPGEPTMHRPPVSRALLALAAALACAKSEPPPAAPSSSRSTGDRPRRGARLLV